MAQTIQEVLEKAAADIVAIVKSGMITGFDAICNPSAETEEVLAKRKYAKRGPAPSKPKRKYTRRKKSEEAAVEADAPEVDDDYVSDETDAE